MPDAQLSPTAVEDVFRHLEYFKQVGAPVSAAIKYRDNLHKIRVLLGQQPGLGIAKPHWGGPPSLHSIPSGNYVFVYTADPTPPLIVKILGAGEDPDMYFGHTHPADLV